jgi:serine/threonine-protein kinase
VSITSRAPQPQAERESEVDDSEPTVLERPVPRIEEAVSNATLASVALDRKEVERARKGMPPIILATLLGAAALQVIVVGRSAAHWPLTVALVLLGGYAAWLRSRLRRAPRVEPRLMVMLAFFMSACTLAAIAYVGVLSPIVAIAFLLVYSSGLSEHPLEAWVMYLTCAIGYQLLAVAVVAGLLPYQDAIIISTARNTTKAFLLLPLVVQVFLAVTFVMSRQTQRVTNNAMLRLERARRQIGQRDALLAEAHADLDRVLDAGKIGRFTGRRVGPYEAGEVIGRGGMGEVYAAVETASGEPVALKVLHPHLREEPQHVERFFREAKVSSSFASPHIVRIKSGGEAEDGSPYIAMELLDGEDLAMQLRERKRLDLAEVQRLVEHVARALGAAQEAGIVHRDIKPQNLFHARTAPGNAVWKVLDFGVSKIGDAGTTLTQGAIIGTPSYMAPEQGRGEVVDHRADVFSLGAIAYRAVTGRPAFAASDPALAIYNVMHVQPVRPRELLDIPEDVELVLALALAKDREKRFRSAQTFASALRDAVRGELDEPFRRAARDLLKAHPWSADRASQFGARA